MKSPPPSCQSCRLLHHGAAASSSPHSIVWMTPPPSPAVPADSTMASAGVVAYPSHSILNLATFDVHRIPSVRTTLRTRTVPNPDLDPAAGDRIITAIAGVPGGSNHSNEEADKACCSALACSFSDGTVTVWHKLSTPEEQCSIEDDGGNGWQEEIILGHVGSSKGTSSSEQEKSKDASCYDTSHSSPTSVADVAGLVLSPSSSSPPSFAPLFFLVSTASVDGIDLHIRPIKCNDDNLQTTTIKVSTHAAASVSLRVLPEQNEVLLIAGSASPRGNKVHVYTVSLDDLVAVVSAAESPAASPPVETIVRHHGSLAGHLDWVTCFAFWDLINDGTSSGGVEDGGFLLASGSHDARIRLWKFHPPMAATAVSADVEDNGSIVHDSEEEDEDDDLDEGEERLRIHHGNGTETAVTLEALLVGHEEAVTSVTFRPPCKNSSSAQPCLMSSSMDRTILLWMEECDDEDESNGSSALRSGGAWVPTARVGAAGGILGGPIGSSLSGFVDATFSPDGTAIAGHGYGGSLHFWKTLERKHTSDIDSERWTAGPCLTGHFRGGVSGISWEVSCGQYLLSTGLDQTCRLWTEIYSHDGVTWHEAGRPQVHGFDLNALVCLPQHRLASGADEKITRIFEAPASTLRLLQGLSGKFASASDGWSEDLLDRPDRAFLPSLGLSNRTTVSGGVEEEEGFEAPVDATATTDNTNQKEQLQVRLPTERDLGVTTLWPEVRKLFGHHYEVVCIATTVSPPGNVIVASACKARDIENSAIMIFEVHGGRCLQVLKGGHRSTVVTLSFSSDGKWLASAGKDRRLCIWRWQEGDQNDGGDAANDDQYCLAAAVDGAHKRIIWSVRFCPSDPGQLATGARDGFAKIWHISVSRGKESDKEEVEIKEALKIEPWWQKDRAAVTAIAFTPTPLPNQNGAVLAIGLETGFIEFWSIKEPSDSPSSDFLFALPRNMCHISSVKDLAFRTNGDKKARRHFTLASCGMDNGVRIFDIECPE